MSIEWNLPFQLGLIGLAVAVASGLWLAKGAITKQQTSKSWLVAVVLLSVVSLLTLVSSPITITSVIVR